MTLIVVFNNEVMVDSCTTIGPTAFTANKIIAIGDVTYTCAGSPDAAQMCVEASLTDGSFDPMSDLSRVPKDHTVIVLKKAGKVWTIAMADEHPTWVRCGDAQGGVQYATGAGAEQFTGFVATGMDVVKAFESVCDVNVYVDRPIRRF